VRASRDVQFTTEALELLSAHSWPGNVRELENVVERLVISCRTDRVSGSEVQTVLGVYGPAASAAAPSTDSPGGQAPAAGGHSVFEQLPSLDELERQYLQYVLDHTKGHRTRTAKILQIDRKRLYRMAQRFGVSFDRVP